MNTRIHAHVRPVGLMPREDGLVGNVIQITPGAGRQKRTVRLQYAHDTQKMIDMHFVFTDEGFTMDMMSEAVFETTLPVPFPNLLIFWRDDEGRGFDDVFIEF